MDRKKVIVIAAALIAIILIAAGAAIALLGGSGGYAARIEDGYRCLESGDLDGALLKFNEALREDSTREEAYSGLYTAYIRLGQNDNALATLRVGVEATGSQTLRDLLTQVEQVLGGASQVVTPPVQEDKDVAAVLNTQLLDVFASATYGDYALKYTDAAGEPGDGTYTLYLRAVGACVIFRDTTSQRAINTATGLPFTDSLPAEIRMDNITSLFGGVARLSFDGLRALQGVSQPAMEGSTITFSYGGCQVSILCTQEGVITADCENSLTPSAGESQFVGHFVLNTSVMDATSGQAVADAKVRAYEGSTATGTPIEGETDYGGNLSLNLTKSGVYTLVVEKSGYITESFEVYIMNNLLVSQQVFHLCPTISGDGIRFVLTWGASPADLDSFLIGSTTYGRKVNVNFTNMLVSDGAGNKIAQLDLDDNNGYGPETTTLYDLTGVYSLVVDDYINSGTISTSGAVVKIYVGSELYDTVAIPAGIADQWHVCNVINGQIIIVNKSN